MAKKVSLPVGLLCCLLALGLLTVTGPPAQAYPNKGTCSNCHGLDPNTSVSVSLGSDSDSDVTYYVSGSDNYNSEEGWAVFDPAGSNIANGYNDGTFTLPKDGETYRVFWVDDADADPTAPDPDKGGSAFEDVTTPTNGEVPGQASADLVRRSAWPEHHHFSLSKDEDGTQTLYGKVKNLGTVATAVEVRFSITGAEVRELTTPATTILPGVIQDLSVGLYRPDPGDYAVSAQCWYDSDGDGSPDTAGQKVKTFKFSVVP